MANFLLGIVVGSVVGTLLALVGLVTWTQDKAPHEPNERTRRAL